MKDVFYTIVAIHDSPTVLGGSVPGIPKPVGATDSVQPVTFVEFVHELAFVLGKD